MRVGDHFSLLAFRILDVDDPDKLGRPQAGDPFLGRQAGNGRAVHFELFQRGLLQSGQHREVEIGEGERHILIVADHPSDIRTVEGIAPDAVQVPRV